MEVSNRVITVSDLRNIAEIFSEQNVHCFVSDKGGELSFIVFIKSQKIPQRDNSSEQDVEMKEWADKLIIVGTILLWWVRVTMETHL